MKALRGDTEEQLEILQALRLSELEAKGFDTRRDSSSGGESMYGFTDDSLGTESSCDSTPDSKVCQKSKCGDVGNEGEEVRSTTPITKISGALDHDQLSVDKTVCDAETEDSSKVTAAVEKTNLESTKTESISEIPRKPEDVTFDSPGKLIGKSVV